MGNCLRRDGSPANWAGEEWDEFPATEVGGSTETERLLEDCGGVFTGGGSREVKIKITKKQLEELLGKEELSVHQVLTQLMKVGDQFHESHHRPWRPALQSIPELD